MSPLLIDDTVKAVLTSRVYDVAVETPLERTAKLSRQTHCDVYLKREDLQSVHSFKLRGAYNKIAQLTEDERKKGVIAASAGNHAQGVALAAKKLGISALIVMPKTTPSIKVDAVKSFGAQVELAGDSYSDAADICKVRTQETGRTYIHPFDDPLVIAGQGTIGREIIEQLPQTTHIFVPVGGGGLIAGIASYVKTLRPDIKVISVEPEDSNALQKSIRANERLVLPHVGIFADGVAVKQVGSRTFALARTKVDEFITVSTDGICAGIKAIFEETRSIVEPAGALATAGILPYVLPEDAHAVAICSGANMTFERLQQVAERTLIGSGQEAMFAVALPEKPGALRTFCSKIVRSHSISEFSYRLSNKKEAHVLVGISISSSADAEALAQEMTAHGYTYATLTHDDTTKEHVRHMIGGRPQDTGDEHIYEVIFPERPGALSDFLGKLGNGWNISLFHYRNVASDSGKVLVGFEAKDPQPLEMKLRRAGFPFSRMDASDGVRLFIK